MIAKVYSAIPDGYNSQIIEVEGDISKNLPSFNIVGMANKTITEARERVRSAITSSDFTFPTKKVTVNLAPAEIIKTGSLLDVPIALNVLILAKQLLASSTKERLFVGELSLDGQIRPIHGIINVIEAAITAGFKEVFVPVDNLSQASLVRGITIYGAKTLRELVLHLQGISALPSPIEQSVVEKTTTDNTPQLLFSDIYGQSLAKRALIIALAGHHNILLSGPPGAGKTMLARAAANLLPPPTDEEQIAITKLHSLVDQNSGVAASRPYRSPHHSASLASIIGGGPQAAPGEVSLAHHGILFLDELPEFPRAVIESLRQPLEDRIISITRVNRKATYPADFILIATMNPCPCGHNGDPTHACDCTPLQIKSYLDKISGPILDRIDLCPAIERIPSQILNQSLITKNVVKNTTSDSDIKKKIAACRNLQYSRYKSLSQYNGTVSSSILTAHLNIVPAAQRLLATASDRFSLSARSYLKILRVARTIADLSNSSPILPEHISEALSYRTKLKH